MSIDLGNSPTPPDANPNESEAIQIRSAIGAIADAPSSGINYIRGSGQWNSVANITVVDMDDYTWRHLVLSLPSNWAGAKNAKNINIESDILLQSYTIYQAYYLETLTIRCLDIPSFFVFNSPLQSLTILECNVIHESAFNGCYTIASIDVDAVLIGESAFSGCSALIGTYFSNRLTNIASYAFSGCTSLAVIEIPSSVQTIDSHAFDSCNALQTVYFIEGIININSAAFTYCNIESLTIPSTVEYIGDNAFSDNINLSYLGVLTESPPAIGTNAFLNTLLTEVHVRSDATGWDGVTTWADLTVVADL